MMELHINGFVFELISTPFNEIVSTQIEEPPCAKELLICLRYYEEEPVLDETGSKEWIQPAIRIGSKRYYPELKKKPNG